MIFFFFLFIYRAILYKIKKESLKKSTVTCAVKVRSSIGNLRTNDRSQSMIG